MPRPLRPSPQIPTLIFDMLLDPSCRSGGMKLLYFRHCRIVGKYL